LLALFAFFLFVQLRLDGFFIEQTACANVLFLSNRAEDRIALAGKTGLAVAAKSGLAVTITVAITATIPTTWGAGGVGAVALAVDKHGALGALPIAVWWLRVLDAGGATGRRVKPRRTFKLAIAIGVLRRNSYRRRQDTATTSTGT